MSSTLRASHLASFQHAIGDQPSIFDILSQESLMTSLKPAMGHLIKFLAMVYSQRFQTAHRYYDELYMLFDLILQNQYLKKYGASFSENFYGMKRVYLATGKSPSDFRSRVRNLMLLVLWPYVSRINLINGMQTGPNGCGSAIKTGKDFPHSLAMGEKAADTCNDYTSLG
ncbi:Pex2 / Pex12 amino terminal region, partial [Ostertagia ostertagi]